MRIEKFDVKEHPSLHDNFNSSAMMESFASSLPSWQIFNCADAAALLIDDFDRFLKLILFNFNSFSTTIL